MDPTTAYLFVVQWFTLMGGLAGFVAGMAVSVPLEKRLSRHVYTDSTRDAEAWPRIKGAEL